MTSPWIITFGLLFLFSPKALPQKTPLLYPAPNPAKTPCGKLAEKSLGAWVKNPEWSLRLEGKDGTYYWVSPTAEVGEWVEMRQSAPENSLELRKITSHTFTRLRWSRDCTPQLETEVVSGKREIKTPSFTDSDLKALLGGQRKGVLYAWSPHMPFSLAGIEKIRSAAKKFSLPVTLVLDGDADPVLAREVAEANHLPSGALRKIQSVELMYRNMPIHFPSVLIFNEGKIKGPVFPGVKEESVYAEFIKDYLH